MNRLCLAINSIAFASFFIVSQVNAEIVFSFDKSIHAEKGGVIQKEDIAGLEKMGVLGTPLNAAAKRAESASFGSGIIGKSLKIGVSSDGKNRYSYSYNPTQDLYTDEGAVMFWVNPVNWKGNDKKFHILFCASSPKNTMFIYKYQNRSDLLFYFNGKYAFASIKDWKPEVWHHVAAVWSKDALYLYIDGRMKKGIQTPKREKRDFKNFIFGSKYNWKGEVGETLIDQVKILPKFINEKAVLTEFSKTAAFIKDANSPIEISVGPATPKLDGILSVNEYGFASGGFFNIKTGKFAATQSRWAMSYDNKNLYFAAVTPVGKSVAAKYRTHDANIWEDDSVEIHVKVSENSKYQFVFNSVGGIFDHKNKDHSWNSKGVKTASKIVKGLWTLECSIPLSNFEKFSKNFYINMCRSFSDTKELTSAAPVISFYADYRNFIKIIPTQNVPAIDILSLGDLNGKKLDFRVSLKNKQNVPTACNFELSTDNKFLPYQKKDTIKLAAKSTKVYLEKKNNLIPNLILSVKITDNNGKALYVSKFPYHDINPATVHTLNVNIPQQSLFVAIKNYTPGMKKFLRIRVLKQDKKNVLSAKKEIKPDSYSKINFDISKLAPGKYVIHTDLMDAKNKVFFTNDFPFNKSPKTPWWSNPTAGLEHDVPIPWTKPVIKNSAFQCLNHTYLFEKGAFLSSINIKGNELLASPAQLKVNGKPAVFKTVCIKGKKMPAVTDYRHIATIDGVSINMEMQAEFDGLLRYTLRVKPAKSPVKLTAMTLELPIKSQYATCFDDCSSSFVKDDLKSTRNKIITKNTVTRPFFRIGDEKIGLLGGMASMRGWYIKNKANSLVVDNKTDKVTVKFNFVDTPLDLNKERVIKFFLQATPTKNKMNMAKSSKAVLWTGYWTTIYEYKVEGYFDDKEIAKLEKKLPPGKEYHWYFTSAGVSPFSPDWNYWGMNWHNDPPAFGTVGADSDLSKRAYRDRNGWTFGCLSSRSFLDFKIRTATDAMTNKKYKVNNVYYDISWPKICWNKEHGCVWYDEFGDRMPTNDWEGMRELHERVYRTLKKKNPDGVMTQHLLCSWSPSDSFCDIIVGGEVYEQELSEKGHYYDCFNPTFMRQHFTARAVDKDYWMIPQFLRAIILYKPAKLKTWKPELPEVKKAMINMLGALYVHNVNCWPIYGTEKLVQKVRKYYHQLTDTDYVFHPYWEKTGPIKGISPNSKKLLASAYEKDGKYFIVVVNNEEKSYSVSVELKGMNNRNAIEALSEKKYVVKGNKLTLTLGPREAKFFFFDNVTIKK